VASMLTVHRALGTWRNDVDWYIAPSEFARDKFVEGGLPAERLSVNPNFLFEDPGVGEGRGGYALFAGRLAEEKGLPVLINAWKRLPSSIHLRVLGLGPLSDWLVSEIAGSPNVEWLGWQPREQVLAQMKGAAALIFPSQCYETGALSIVEGFATGLPAIASNHGTMAALIRHRHNGLLFQPGDAEALAAEVRWFFDHESTACAMRRSARAEFEHRYTKKEHYERLIAIYQRASMQAEIQ